MSITYVLNDEVPVEYFLIPTDPSNVLETLGKLKDASEAGFMVYELTEEQLDGVDCYRFALRSIQSQTDSD